MLNAMNLKATQELNQAAEAIRADPDVRVVLVRGAGRAFCTGIDLKELSVGGSGLEYHEYFERALRIFETMEKIVLVGLHGYCLGGGLQLALACDIRIATPDCIIGLPAIRECLIPGLSTFRLARYVGLGRAKHLVLSGDNIDGNRAHEIGLVDHLVPEKDFPSEVGSLAEKYLRACSEGSRQSKVLLTAAADMPHGQFLQEYQRRQTITQLSPDHEEAMAAYREKRDPVWN
jgi:enoyl-CoA hydratase/carnithine racemase